MKISKIILFFVSFLLSFLFFTKWVFAVQFNWNNEIRGNIPWVQVSDDYSDKELAGKELWSPNIDERSNNVISIVCISRMADGNCDRYLTNLLYFFQINVTSKTYVDFTIWEIKLSKNKYGSNWIKFYIDSVDTNLDGEKDSVQLTYKIGSSKFPVVTISNQHKCWTQNPQTCVIALNSFFTYSAKGTTNGIYFTYADVMVYNNPDDTFEMHRLHREVADGAKVGWFQSIMQFIDNYKGWYGARISEMKDGDIVFSRRKDNGDFEYTMFKTQNWVGYFKTDNKNDFWLQWNNLLLYPYCDIAPYNGLCLWQKNDLVFEKSNEIIPLMNKYLWDDDYKWIKWSPITYTLKNVFKFKSGSFSASTKSDDKCANFDIGCHVKNWIGGFFKWLWDFFWTLWQKISDFFLTFWKSLLYSIVEVAKEIWSVFASIWNFIKVLFWDGSMYTFLAQNESLSCWENGTYDYSWSLAIPGVIPGTKAHQVISPILQTFALAVPSIPHDGDVICTFAGYQQIKYKGNSPIDLILVMIFSFAILFLFTKRYGSSQ